MPCTLRKGRLLIYHTYVGRQTCTYTHTLTHTASTTHILYIYNKRALIHATNPNTHKKHTQVPTNSHAYCSYLLPRSPGVFLSPHWSLLSPLPGPASVWEIPVQTERSEGGTGSWRRMKHISCVFVGIKHRQAAVHQQADPPVPVCTCCDHVHNALQRTLGESSVPGKERLGFRISR